MDVSERLLAQLLRAEHPVRSEVSEIPPYEGDVYNQIAGMVAQAPGMPMDMLALMAQLRSGARGGEGVPYQDIPMTTEWIGERMGADTESPEFITGTIAVPDMVDIGKFAALMMARVPHQGLKRLADSFFDKKALDDARWIDDAGNERPPSNRKEILIYMTPDEFLDMALHVDKSSEYSKGKLRGVRDVAKANKRFSSVPFLKFKNEGSGLARVTGHEGRHRAMYLREEGIEAMPVILKSEEGGAGGIRWSRFEGGWGDKYLERKDWPKLLREEQRSSTKRLIEKGLLNDWSNEMTFPVDYVD